MLNSWRWNFYTCRNNTPVDRFTTPFPFTLSSTEFEKPFNIINNNKKRRKIHTIQQLWRYFNASRAPFHFSVSVKHRVVAGNLKEWSKAFSNKWNCTIPLQSFLQITLPQRIVIPLSLPPRFLVSIIAKTTHRSVEFNFRPKLSYPDNSCLV